MAKYKLVSNDPAVEQVFLVKYPTVLKDNDFTPQYQTTAKAGHQDIKMLTMVEGVEYELTAAQVNDFLRKADGTINSIFVEVVDTDGDGISDDKDAYPNDPTNTPV